MKKIKLRISNWLFKHLFSLVLEEEILRGDPKTGELYHRGNKLTREQVSAIASQARVIHQSEVWHLLLLEMRELAIRKGCTEALSMDDVLGSKMVLYTIDILSKKVYNLSTRV